MTRPADINEAILTTSAPRPTAPSPVTIGCLVAAPLLAAVARWLAIPYWDDPVEYVSQVSENPGRSDLGVSLAIVSALLFIPALLGVARLAGERAARTSAVGAALSVVGCAGMISISSSALVGSQAVRLGPQENAVQLWDHVWNDPKLWTTTLVHVGALGCILLAVALYRSRAVPRTAAVLTGLGAGATMTTSAGPVRPLLIAAALLCLAAFTWLATTKPRPPTP